MVIFKMAYTLLRNLNDVGPLYKFQMNKARDWCVP